jgi:hypothetical protein
MIQMAVLHHFSSLAMAGARISPVVLDVVSADCGGRMIY